MRNTVPPSTVVLNEPDVGSLKPSLSTGKPFVDQTTQDDAPGRLEITFFAISSTSTLARPSLVCPVTTRRICRLIMSILPGHWFGLFAFRFFQKGRKDRGDARLGRAPFLAIPFLQEIAVRALFHDIVVQFAVGDERGSLARGCRRVDHIIAGNQAG